MTILVVEDDLALRNALRRSLLLAGYDAVGVADGQQALDMVEAAS